MHKLSDKHHYPTVDGALRFFAVRAKGRPETAPLVPKVVETRATLREKREAYLAAYDERVAQTAEIVYLDSRIDRLVLVGLKRDLAVLTAEHPKGAQLEKKLFQGVAPSVGMKPVASESQEHYVAGIVKRLEDDADFASLAPHAKKLHQGQQEIDDALDRRKEARVKERLAQGDLEDALEDARRIYNQLHPQLQLTFPNDPALVESYFRELYTKSDEAEGDAPDAGGEVGKTDDA
ncbi:Hypothetical protein A7982_05446 [Minicystis rosea]|nr:Hypothetical protein A7982_05446 [Minicystis rosea]